MSHQKTQKYLILSFVLVGLITLPYQADELMDAYKESTRLMQEGKYAEAIPFAERAYELGIKRYGRLHTTTTTLAMNIGTITLFSGQFEKARPLLRRALKSTETVHGEGSLNLVDPMIRLAQALATTDDEEPKGRIERNMKEAAELYNTALTLAKGNLNPLAIANIELEAAMVFARSVFGAAHGLAFANAAYEKLTRVGAQNVEPLARAGLWVGILQARQGETEDAQHTLEQSLNIPNSEQVSVRTKRAIHVELVRLFESSDRSAEATPHVRAVSVLTPLAGRELAQISPIYWSHPDWSELGRLPSQEIEVVVEFGIDNDGFIVEPVFVEMVDEKIKEIVLASLQKWRYALPSTSGEVNSIEQVRYEFLVPSRSRQRQLGTKISGLEPVRGVSDRAPMGDVVQGGMRSGS